MEVKSKNNLNKRLLYAILLGLIVGLIVGEGRVADFLKEYLVFGALNIIGQMFLRILSMITIPIVMITLVNGIARIGNIKRIGKIGLKIILYNSATTIIAISIAIGLSFAFAPGSELNIADTSYTPAEVPHFVDSLVRIIPGNPFSAIAQGNLLPSIMFAILIGISIAILGKKVGKTIDLLQQANKLVLKMFQLIMGFAPIGVFALVLNVFVKQGFDGYQNMLKYILILVGTLVIHSIFIYGGILKFIVKISPKMFFKKFKTVALTAFATSSSNATIPITMYAARYKMGVPRKISSAIIPLGTVSNMDGTAIMQGAAVILIAQAYNVELSFFSILTIIIYTMLSTMGTPGIPSGGLVTLALVLKSVQLPVEGIVLIVGVDRMLDMARTVINVAGDTVGALFIANTENVLDREVFNDPKAGKNESMTFEQLQVDIVKNKK